MEIKKENSLAYKYPLIALQWHPTKNEKLSPSDVTGSSGKKVWWYLPYDDPKTGKHFDFEWQAAIYSRTSSNGNSCPFLSGNKVWKGFNDLQSLRPDLAREWHPAKNNELMASHVTIGSNKKVWWYLPYDDPETGKHFDFEWQDTISHRASMNRGWSYVKI